MREDCGSQKGDYLIEYEEVVRDNLVDFQDVLGREVTDRYGVMRTLRGTFLEEEHYSIYFDIVQILECDDPPEPFMIGTISVGPEEQRDPDVILQSHGISTKFMRSKLLMFLEITDVKWLRTLEDELGLCEGDMFGDITFIEDEDLRELVFKKEKWFIYCLGEYLRSVKDGSLKQWKDLFELVKLIAQVTYRYEDKSMFEEMIENAQTEILSTLVEYFSDLLELRESARNRLEEVSEDVRQLFEELSHSFEEVKKSTPEEKKKLEKESKIKRSVLCCD